MKGCLGGRRRGSRASLGRGVQEDVSKELMPNMTDVLGQEVARLEIRHSPAYSRCTRGLVGLKAVGSDGAEEKGSGQSTEEPPSCDYYYLEPEQGLCTSSQGQRQSTNGFRQKSKMI